MPHCLLVRPLSGGPLRRGNVVVARTVGRAALGVGPRLDEVMFLGPLQLVRDGPRKVSYRGKSSREKQTLINTAWVSMPVGILIALGIAFLLHMHPPNSKADSDSIEPAVYTRSIAYTFFGVVLAFLHEPMFLLALSDMKQGLRARVTVAAQFGKSFVQVILLVVFADKGFGVEAFALANVAYAGFSCWAILLILRSAAKHRMSMDTAYPFYQSA